MWTESVPVLGAAAKITQICFVVPDMERALAAPGWVGDLAGALVWRYEPDDFTVSMYRGSHAPFSELAALVPRTPVVELVQPLLGPSVFDEHVAEDGYGLHHLGITVSDVQPVTDAMAEAGFPEVQRLAGWGEHGDGEAAFFDTRSALGFWLEAVSPSKRRRTPLVTL